jgi:hypothetical protein
VSDIDPAVVKSLKALDPNRPIREADMAQHDGDVRFVPIADIISRPCLRRLQSNLTEP